MRVATQALILGSLAALGVSCSREHLTRAQGRSYAAFFQQQRASKTVAHRPAAIGLDSQEADIIADSYRRSLAPKDTKQQSEEPVIFVAPPAQASQRYTPPPPSVPPK